MRRLNVVAAGLIGFILVTAPYAVAHAALASSNPKDGATLKTMPAEVSLTLNEPAQGPAFVAVTSVTGARVNSDEIVVRDKTVTSKVDKGVTAGKYTMAYRIPSADRHVVTGTVDFEVLRSDAAAPSATPTSPAPSKAEDAISNANSSDDSRPYIDALIVLGFAVVAFTGLVLLVRHGLKSADGDD